MRMVRISEEVWQEIAERGKFGETEDDVLRRVFNLPTATNSNAFMASDARPKTLRSQSIRTQHSTQKMHAAVHGDHLVVYFHDGPERRWLLPDRSNKAEIRRIREEAVRFALENNASDPGQTNAVRKALTEASYYLTR